MKERIIIRKVTEADAQVLLDIYAPYVATPITFENEIPTVEEFARRIREIAAFYPYLVCEVEGRIVGYAYAHRQMERAAYQWNAELSVYIDAAFAGQGIGKQLYTRLIELLKQQHVKTLYALITLPNEASIALHRSFGRWHDVMWMDLHIASMEGEPEALEPCRYME